jgi:hypothetical protein
VLEGSVQRGGNRMRVNVQLINAETGDHLWAERFDKPVTDLFDMQDEIVARLAGQLGTALMEAEARRAERSPHPDLMDLCFQGVACLNKGYSPDNLARARGFFARALALDSNNVGALVGQGFVDVIEGTGLAADNAHIAAAEAAATKALSVAPNYALAQFLLGGGLQWHEPRCARYCRLRACAGAGPEPGRRPYANRCGKNEAWAHRGD